jgi:hypothetical protein
MSHYFGSKFVRKHGVFLDESDNTLSGTPAEDSFEVAGLRLQ